MIRTLRALFLARLLREKLLLVAFAVLGVAMWFSGFSTRAGIFWREQRSTSTTLEEQKQWLTNRAAIDAAAQKAVSRLDPAQTLDGTRLLTEVSSLAAAAGLRNTTNGEFRDESNGQFSVHTMLFTVSKAEWLVLQKFYLSLQARSPYVGIEQFTLQSDRANPALLTAVIRVSSVEVAK